MLIFEMIIYDSLFVFNQEKQNCSFLCDTIIPELEYTI